MSATKVLAGVLAGFAAGALVGILFAPDKGSVTRRRWLERGNDMLGDLKDTYDDTVDGIRDRFSEAGEELEDTVERGARTAKEAVAGAAAQAGKVRATPQS